MLVSCEQHQERMARKEALDFLTEVSNPLLTPCFSPFLHGSCAQQYAEKLFPLGGGDSGESKDDEFAGLDEEIRKELASLKSQGRRFTVAPTVRVYGCMS